MPDATSQVPSLIIQELNGQRRKLTLMGRALPYRPIGFPRTQRVNVTWYAGNARATSTVLGAALENTTFQGKWKEKYLATGDASVSGAATQAPPGKIGGGRTAGEQLTTLRDLIKMVDSFISAGALLEVRWFSEVRQGHLVKFDPQWDNTNDAAWSMEFEWTGTGEDAARPPAPTGPSEPSAVADALAGAIKNATASMNAPPMAPAPDRLRELQDGLAAMNDSVVQLQDGIGTAARQALAPYDTVRRAASVLSGLVGQASFVVAEATATPPEFLFHAATASDPRTLGQGFRAAAALYGDTQARNARRTRREAALARANTLRTAENDLLAVYEAREGDNLRDVSARYYGTPAQWRALLLFNQLESAELATGQLVLVPRSTDEGSAGASP